MRRKTTNLIKLERISSSNLKTLESHEIGSKFHDIGTQNVFSETQIDKSNDFGTNVIKFSSNLMRCVLVGGAPGIYK